MPIHYAGENGFEMLVQRLMELKDVNTIEPDDNGDTVFSLIIKHYVTEAKFAFNFLVFK